MKIDILTIFPEFCLPYAKGSLIGKAVENGILDIRVHDIRANTQDRHNKTDDTPLSLLPSACFLWRPQAYILPSLFSQSCCLNLNCR